MDKREEEEESRNCIHGGTALCSSSVKRNLEVLLHVIRRL